MTPEGKLQKKVLDYCREKYDWDVRTPAGVDGIRDGSPDYMLPIEGVVLFVEFKHPDKKPEYRPLQEETIAYLRKLGHVAFAVKDYDVAIKIIDSREFDSKIINSKKTLIEMEDLW